MVLRHVKNLMLLVASIGFSLLLAEFVTNYWMKSTAMDPRSRFEVAKTYSLLKGEGYAPALYPSMFLTHGITLGSGQHLLPLTGISNKMTVFCNEGGGYSTYLSDRFGFNNDDTLWDKDNHIILIGDSFVHGSCVNANETISAVINKKTPQYNTLSMGVGGTSLLTQVGIFKEFRKHSTSSTYYWFYYEGNDLAELEREYGSPILSKYLLDPYYSQGLKKNKIAIDNWLADWSENSAETILKGRLSFLTLRSLRILYNTLHTKIPNLSNYDLDLFRTSLDSMKDLVRRDGNRLVFVYLPSIYRFQDSSAGTNNFLRELILNEVKLRDIEYIDITTLFAASSDPLSYFPQRRHMHYNSKGYELVADAVVAHASLPLVK
jgi:hypothetical protein